MQTMTRASTTTPAPVPVSRAVSGTVLYPESQIQVPMLAPATGGSHPFGEVISHPRPPTSPQPSPPSPRVSYGNFLAPIRTS